MRASWQQVSRADPVAFIWDEPAPSFVLSSSFAPYNRLSTTVGLVVPGIRFDSGSGNGYLIGSDGRVVPAASRTVSTLLPFTGGLASDPEDHCLWAGSLSELALPLSRRLPIGEWIVSIRYQTVADATVIFGDGSVRIPKGLRSIFAPVATTAPTHEIVLQSPARTPICIQMSVEDPMATGSAQG